MIPRMTFIIGSRLSSACCSGARAVVRAATGSVMLALLVSASPAALAEAAGTRIFMSVDRNGNATFSDHAQPGAASLSVRTYETPADAQSQARARAEREYWRAQADAFAQRQRARERERERDLARANTARTQEPPVYWADVPVRRYFRAGPPHSVGVVPQGPAAATTYQGGPGAASRAGAAFIGSGFAGAR